MKYKRHIFLGGLILLLSVGIVTVTVAALTNNKTHKSVKNEFAVGNVSISVMENGSDTVKENKENTLSWDGYSAQKEVAVQNNNTGNPLDVFVRIALVPKWIMQETVDGETMAVEMQTVAGVKPFGDLRSLTFSGKTAGLGDITLVFNETWSLQDGCFQSDNWFYADGFFYCKKAVKPGEKSPLLLKEVRITETALNTINLLNITFQLNVDADGIQTEDGSVENKWGSYGVVKEEAEIKFKKE